MSRIREQLEAEKRLFGYRYHSDASVDQAFTEGLEDALIAWGLTDIRELGFHSGTQTGTRYRSEVVERGDGYETLTIAEPVTYPVAWFFNRRTNARLSTATTIDADCVSGMRDRGDAQEWFECPRVPGPDDAIPLWVVSGPDRWQCEMFAAFLPDGTPYFLPKPYRQQSSWQSFREALVFFFSVASFAVPGLGATIGVAVFGAQTAAAYPALVAVATQTALQAVLGGGDIESAVKRAVASYLSGGVGNMVGAGVDSALIGRLTGAATHAALTGGDIEQAVAIATLQYGASGAVVFDEPAKGVAMDDYGDLNYTPVEPVGSVNPFDYVFDVGSGEMIDLSGDPYFSGGSDVPANVPPLSPVESGGTSWNSVLQTVSTTALTALQLYKAYQSAGAPAPKAGLPSQVVNANGTITTRSPNGTSSTTKPATGQPYVMADGTIMMNNGDGTYTLIAPNGSRTTKRYADTGGGLMTFGGGDGVSQQQMLIIGALGLGALYLFTRKRN